MKVCTDIRKSKPKIISSIAKFGFSPEHNYYHYVCEQAPHRRCVFFDFGNLRGLMAHFSRKNNVWHVTNEVLAPPGERLGMFMEFLDYALAKKKAKKVVAEFGSDFKSKVFSQLKKSKYRASMNYALYWPVFNIKDWDEKLGGRQWKKFRNIRNRFSNHLTARAVNPRKAGKDKLRALLSCWLKRRHPTDRVDCTYYSNVIDSNFKGFEVVRGISIGNELCSASAGWKIPNSDSFYCGIGLFNYKHKDLGEFVNLDDLMHLKKIGYSKVDLGGSGASLLSFKKKFKPEKIYKTYVFSIIRK